MSSADNTLSVLSLFTLDSPEWSVEIAAQHLGFSVSTTYRYFSALTTSGFLEPVGGGCYMLGPAIIEYDRQIRLLDPFVQAARPFMRALLEQFDGQGVALLCRRFRQGVMCIHQERTMDQAPAVAYERGRPMGLFRGASSLVVLANLGSRAISSVWQKSRDEIAAAGLGEDLDGFRAALKGIRSRGGAVTVGHLDKGMAGIAAPLFLRSRNMIGSLSIVCPAGNADPSAFEEQLSRVRDAARQLNESINQGL